ncbi:SDR family NAD(P)-dependent oxidoreductase [Frankia sp. QA3]|uniref:SDR family NAD(P)-dependent oxidoreductase n=1 Tax=Frankia sp. QA3 TaxID=710111 RepID=UPI001E5B8317|nr:SDR family NAD(P)-dependent oxidoreductase [Frankia sp. QA3]
MIPAPHVHSRTFFTRDTAGGPARNVRRGAEAGTAIPTDRTNRVRPALSALAGREAASRRDHPLQPGTRTARVRAAVGLARRREPDEPRRSPWPITASTPLAFIGIPLQAPYCAAKFACRGFFESARAELLHDGSAVRMSMVHLPAVNTPPRRRQATDGRVVMAAS